MATGEGKARGTAASKGASSGKGKAKTVTETLDTSARTVGPLKVFGIKASEFWRVPAILPKRYQDLTQPVVEYEKLPRDGMACVGGKATKCELLGSEDVEAGDEEIELFAPAADGVDAAASTDGDDVLEEGGESDTSEGDELADEGEATRADGGAELGEDAGPEGEEGPRTAKLNTWRVTLADISGRRHISFSVVEKGSAERNLLERARSGGVIWVYGRAVRENGEAVMHDAQSVDASDIGEVHAFYPSRTRKEYLKPVRKKGSKKRPGKGKWVVRKMSSTTTGVLVRDKNRFAIARCAQNLRGRLGLKEAEEEWLLMKTVGSPGPTLEATLKIAHRPNDVQSGEAACRALEKLTAVEILQKLIEEREARPLKEEAINPRRKAFEAALEQIERNGKIVLSDEQKMCATEILVDLGSEKRTHRMLSGDVGTGKTLVFAAVAATLCADGHLVAILEPRSSLASQVHRKLKQYFPDLKHQLVTGESKEQKAIKAGILVGTTGIWSRLKASGCAPALIVADEQQKFGVTQRQPLEHGGTNVLEATATAIPRTQALMEFGGIEVSRLTHCHVKKIIETKVVEGREALDGLYAGLKEAVEQRGRNLLLIYPVINGKSEDSEAEVKAAENEESTPEAVNEVRDFWESMFPGKVEVIHGLMTEQERDGALRKFETGKSSVMIGTSILEVGIDLPKADMMVIHRPERLGVSAVHQLRGRLARQGGHGWCYLAVGEKISEGQMKLMKLMETENDGFKLAVADMERRGFGDMRKHARQQSGLYEGFLVDRPPTIENIEWAQDHCKRWIGGEEAVGDLLEDSAQWMEAAGKLLEEKKRSRKGRQGEGADQTEGNAPTGEQQSLFGN